MPLYRSEPVFEVQVERASSNGRARLLAGYRPDIKIDGELYPVYPDFIGENGTSIPEGEWVDLPAKATMHPLSQEVRAGLHKRIHVGDVLEMCEGMNPVALARVTRLIDV